MIDKIFQTFILNYVNPYVYGEIYQRELMMVVISVVFKKYYSLGEMYEND